MHPLNPRALIGIAAVLGILAVAGLLAAQPWWASLAHAQDSPSAALELSADSVEPGTEITATMSFSNLEADTDTSTTDYIFRADVVDADACEGGGMGNDRYFYKVDDDPETRGGTVSANCPAGDYTVKVTLSSADNTELDSATAGFTIAEPEPEPTPESTPEPTPTPEPITEPEETPAKLTDTDPPAIVLMALGLSPSGPVEEGTAITATMSFGNLESNADTSDVDYIFRADVVDADKCEGSGLGVDRYMYKVDEDPEERTGTISASCPPGDYTFRASISSPDNTELASIRTTFIVEAEPEVAGAQGDPPTVSISLSPSASVTAGTEITATMAFANLPHDSDPSTRDYIIRADLSGGVSRFIKYCEGARIGDEIPFSSGGATPTIEGTIKSSCPAGSYALIVRVLSPERALLASAAKAFTVKEPECNDYKITMNMSWTRSDLKIRRADLDEMMTYHDTRVPKLRWRVRENCGENGRDLVTPSDAGMGSTWTVKRRTDWKYTQPAGEQENAGTETFDSVTATLSAKPSWASNYDYPEEKRSSEWVDAHPGGDPSGDATAVRGVYEYSYQVCSSTNVCSGWGDAPRVWAGTGQWPWPTKWD